MDDGQRHALISAWNQIEGELGAHRARRSMIGMANQISPAAIGNLRATVRERFRVERLIVSSDAFGLSIWQTIATFPVVALGAWIHLVFRALAFVLRVDTRPQVSRREYLTHDQVEALSLLAVEYDDDDRPYRLVTTPENRRARFMRPIYRSAVWLMRMRTRMRDRELGHLRIDQIWVGGRRMLMEPVSIDIFLPNAFGAGLHLESCNPGAEIRIDVRNTSSRPAHVKVTAIGMAYT